MTNDQNRCARSTQPRLREPPGRPPPNPGGYGPFQPYACQAPNGWVTDELWITKLLSTTFCEERHMTVTTERAGAVTTVVLSRPEVRNAVDFETAQALADAFRAFEADDPASVAVVAGGGGTGCGGA